MTDISALIFSELGQPDAADFMTGSRAKLLAAFAEHQQGLTRFLLRRLGNHALAEDLTQETWLRVAAAGTAGSAAPSQALVSNPRSYLYRVAANLATDHQRHEQQGVELSAEPDYLTSIADLAPSPEKIISGRQELAALLKALDALPPRCREVFLLTKMEGLSYAETAERLGISKNTVMVHMANALAQLSDYRRPVATSVKN